VDPLFPALLADQRSHRESERHVKPTYPRYRHRRMITIVQYCSSGFNPCRRPRRQFRAPAPALRNGLVRNAIYR
jgi:hypothetical protein